MIIFKSEQVYRVQKGEFDFNPDTNAKWKPILPDMKLVTIDFEYVDWLEFTQKNLRNMFWKLFCFVMSLKQLKNHKNVSEMCLKKIVFVETLL